MAEAVEALRDKLLAYLAGHNTASLATSSGGSSNLDLWASSVFYASDGFDLIFFSSPSCRHARNLAQSQSAAPWLEIDRENFKARVVAMPKREDLQPPAINEQLIVELYSK